MILVELGHYIKETPTNVGVSMVVRPRQESNPHNGYILIYFLLLQKTLLNNNFTSLLFLLFCSLSIEGGQKMGRFENTRLYKTPFLVGVFLF